MPSALGVQVKTLPSLTAAKGPRSESPAAGDGCEVEVTVSIGGVTSGKESVDELLRSADDAVYRAKASGRNRVVMAAALTLGPHAQPDELVVGVGAESRT